MLVLGCAGQSPCTDAPLRPPTRGLRKQPARAGAGSAGRHAAAASGPEPSCALLILLPQLHLRLLLLLHPRLLPVLPRLLLLNTTLTVTAVLQAAAR